MKFPKKLLKYSVFPCDILSHSTFMYIGAALHLHGLSFLWNLRHASNLCAQFHFKSHSAMRFNEAVKVWTNDWCYCNNHFSKMTTVVAAIRTISKNVSFGWPDGRLAISIYHLYVFSHSHICKRRVKFPRIHVQCAHVWCIRCKTLIILLRYFIVFLSFHFQWFCARVHRCASKTQTTIKKKMFCMALHMQQYHLYIALFQSPLISFRFVHRQ